MLSRRILPVNLFLVMVGLADLLTTVVWLQAGIAVEFNPVMAAVLRLGLPAFVLIKLATIGAYVVVMEWYRRNRNELFARKVGTLTVSAYLGIYAISFGCVNYSYFLG